MKKILFLVAAAMMAATSVNAQDSFDEPKQEVAISLGGLSNSDIITVFENLGAGLIGVTVDNDSFLGPISAEYFYHVKPWLGIGGIVVYGQMSQDVYLMGKDKGKDGDLKNHYFTVMPAVKFDWLRKKNVGLYSKLAIGATLRNEQVDYLDADKEGYDESDWHVNWQASLIGVEVGGVHLRGFLELGTGEQGIGLIGLPLHAAFFTSSSGSSPASSLCAGVGCTSCL